MKNLVIMKRLIVILACINFATLALSQQLPLYSQYLYNKFLINPAHAGSDGLTSYNITAREQWVGYAGAPRTFSVSGQTRILKKKYRLKQNIFDQTVYVPKTEGKVGFGGYIFSDRNGLVQRTGFQTSYSYHLWLEDYTQISMGLAFTGYHYKINVDETSFRETNEPLLSDNLRRGVFIPDVDFGIYLLNPRYEVGFSALQLAGAAAKLGNNSYKNYWMDRHYYLFGSVSLPSGVKAEFKPSTLIKISEQFRPQADIGLTYTYDTKFWMGMSYRTGSSIVTNIGMKYVNSRIKMTSVYLGYSFDFALNKIQRVTYGTHEIVIALKLGDSAKRFRWKDRY